MAYLDWSGEAGIELEHSEESPRRTALRLGMPSELLGVLREELGRVLSDSTEELRLILPKDWTIFWKARPGSESRLLLAHPEKEQWVATLALNQGHAEALLARMEQGERVEIGSLRPVGAFSNFELVLEPRRR